MFEGIVVKISESWVNKAIFYLIIVAIGLVVRYFSPLDKFKRVLRKTRPMTPQKAQEGAYVRVQGMAKPLNEIKQAPLTERACLIYEASVDQKTNRYWRNIITKVSQDNFIVEVGNELVLINMDVPKSCIQVRLDIDRDGSSGILHEPSKNLLRFLNYNQKESTTILGFNKTFRYTEGILAPEEMVTVKGIASWKTLSDPLAGYSYSRILELKGTADHPLLISDQKKMLKL